MCGFVPIWLPEEMCHLPGASVGRSLGDGGGGEAGRGNVCLQFPKK